MMPTLSDADQVIIDKLTYRFEEPRRYDIIAFPYRYGQDTYYVKRIIGLPGETVQINAQGIIFIDGEALDEQYGAEEMNQPGCLLVPHTLGEDEYFVLGDNRNHSTDSRDALVGMVHGSEVIGKVVFRMYPFASFGRVE